MRTELTTPLCPANTAAHPAFSRLHNRAVPSRDADPTKLGSNSQNATSSTPPEWPSSEVRKFHRSNFFDSRLPFRLDGSPVCTRALGSSSPVLGLLLKRKSFTARNLDGPSSFFSSFFFSSSFLTGEATATAAVASPAPSAPSLGSY